MITRLTAGMHGRITVVVSIFAILIGTTRMAAFGSARQGTDVNAVLVIGIAIAGAIVALGILALRLDQRFPQSSLVEASVRLLMPVLVLLAGTSFVINYGIFYGSDQAFLVTFAITAIFVATTWTLVGRTRPDPAEAPSSAPVSADQPEAPTMAAPRSLAPGPPQWPAAPPKAWAEAPSQPLHTAGEPASTIAGKTQPPVEPSIAHRITSGIITLLWFPLGFLVWLAVNWCPDAGTAEAVNALSILFVAVQLGGNATAGWLLDRRYGNQGGTLLSIGRSVLVAAVLLVAVGYFLGALAPDGTSNYCG